MGSIITLGIEKLELDWGKNGIARDYSSLFQKTDIHKELYYYADNVVERKEALSAPLAKIKKRLDLLGFTLERTKKEYMFLRNEYSEMYSEKPPLSFNGFFKIITSLDVASVKLLEDDDFFEDYDFGRYFSYIIAKKLNIQKIEKWDGEFFENLDPLLTIRLLAENKDNLDKKIIWRFKDVLEGGYIKREDVIKEPEESNRYLIVTEGSSDLFVIKKSFEIFHPEVTDLFHFIDMQNNYPFTGCSNLYKFLQGLAKVRPINKVLAIFDNDTAGNEQFNLCKKLLLPRNIKTIKLPELSIFKKFLTRGPSGKKYKNINGTAVSIECFLDLDYKTSSKAIVRWSNYVKHMNQYQGALEDKESFVKIFKNAKKDSDYNFSNLEILCDYIIKSCVEINKNC